MKLSEAVGAVLGSALLLALFAGPLLLISQDWEMLKWVLIVYASLGLTFLLAWWWGE